MFSTSIPAHVRTYAFAKQPCRSLRNLRLAPAGAPQPIGVVLLKGAKRLLVVRQAV